MQRYTLNIPSSPDSNSIDAHAWSLWASAYFQHTLVSRWNPPSIHIEIAFHCSIETQSRFSNNQNPFRVQCCFQSKLNPIPCPIPSESDESLRNIQSPFPSRSSQSNSDRIKFTSNSDLMKFTSHLTRVQLKIKFSMWISNAQPNQNPTTYYLTYFANLAKANLKHIPHPRRVQEASNAPIHLYPNLIPNHIQSRSNDHHQWNRRRFQIPVWIRSPSKPNPIQVESIPNSTEPPAGKNTLRTLDIYCLKCIPR